MFGNNTMLFGGGDPGLSLVLIFAIVGAIVAILVWAMRGTPKDRRQRDRRLQDELIAKAQEKNRTLKK